MTGNLFLAKYLAFNVKKCENHTLIIAVDHKTCSVRMNFNLTFMSNKFTCVIEPKLQEMYNMIKN